MAHDSDSFWDEIREVLIDPTKTRRVEASELPPPGEYRTDPISGKGAPTLEGRKITPKDGSPSRVVYKFRAIGEATIDGKAYTRKLEFDISPEERFAPEYADGQPTGQRCDGEDGRPLKYDLSTRLWANAQKAYKTKYHEEPKTNGAVLDFLTEQPISVRIYADPRGEHRVGGISAVR